MEPAALLAVTSILISAAALDFKVEKYTQSPGLYFEHLGEAQLYNEEWKLVTYINLNEVDKKFEVVKKYVKLTAQFCGTHAEARWVNKTNCRAPINNIVAKMQSLEDIKSLIAQSARRDEQQLRWKRGTFNFIGTISKILFGTMDEDDASYYADKISEIEKLNVDTLKLTREQVTVIKSTLRAINGTLQDVILNESNLQKGLETMEGHINAQTGKIKEMFTVNSLAIEMNRHALLLTSLIRDVRQDYEMILDAIISAQKGILQPQIISPAKIIKLVKDGITDMPSDLSLPIPLSVAYGSVLLKLIDYDVFLHDNVLGYVIRLPLTDNVKFNVYNVHPLPIATKDSVTTYTFILPDKEYLLIDTVKQYYVKIDKSELDKCKVLTSQWRVCKQNYPIMSSHLHEECEVKMLQHVKEVPLDCSQRIAKLTRTLWTQINNNEWLFVSPNPETLTVSCQGQQPSDVILNGTGKIKFFKTCKGYGSTTIIQSQGTVRTNVTSYDIIPSAALEYDCCIYGDQKVNLSEILLNLPMKHMVNHLADLDVASHKVEEVEKLLDEQEWKMKHYNTYKHMSFLSYIGSTVMVMIVITCCCCYCRCCRQILPKTCKWMKDSESCTKIVFRPKIINKVSTSSECLALNPLESGKTRNSLERTNSLELTHVDLAALKMKPAGKR